VYFFHFFPSFSPPDIVFRERRRELKQTGGSEVRFTDQTDREALAIQ